MRVSFALFERLRDQMLRDEGLDASFGEMFMGMGVDDEYAVEEGATMVRIGSISLYSSQITT